MRKAEARENLRTQANCNAAENVVAQQNDVLTGGLIAICLLAGIHLRLNGSVHYNGLIWPKTGPRRGIASGLLPTWAASPAFNQLPPGVNWCQWPDISSGDETGLLRGTIWVA